MRGVLRVCVRGVRGVCGGELSDSLSMAGCLPTKKAFNLHI